ncbi:helix-turn-helix domain-containing protein [Flagellimonas sp.]|uniref:helix-turn-helix domain-containing protein n=1 Tax=Flagellimonas sp. TaxID=2058762 RepID=UPI003B51DF3F
MFKLPYIFLCLLLGFVNFYGQDSAEISLKDLDFDEIKRIWIEEPDSYRDTYFDHHVAKAKELKDTLQWAHAYRYLSREVDMEQGIKYLDSSMTIAQNIKLISQQELEKFMALAHFSKAAIYYLNYVDDKAVVSFIESYHWARKAKDIYFQSVVLSEIANAKAEFGQESEAILLIRKNLEFLKQNQGKMERWDESYLLNLHNMSRCLTFAKKTDSAKVYIKRAIQFANRKGNYEFYQELIILDAQIEYYKGNWERARDTILKYAESSIGSSKADKLFYLGEIEGEMGNFDLKRSHFIKFDSIMASLKYPLFDNANEVYQSLLKDAIKRDDKEGQQYYLDRLIYYDSLLIKTQNHLQEITLKEFDLPLEAEEKSLSDQLIAQKSKLLLGFYVLCAVLFLGLASVYFRYRKTKSRLAKVMSQPVQVEKGQAKGIQNTDDKLDTQMLSTVLDSLNLWEKELGFLDGSVTQHDLAKMIKTNSTYLSQTINHYKGQNFSSYLKDIRITYAINHLKENPGMAKTMSMIQIAEHYGFNSLPVFSKTLKRKIGVTPGVFIKQLVKEKDIS